MSPQACGSTAWARFDHSVVSTYWLDLWWYRQSTYQSELILESTIAPRFLCFQGQSAFSEAGDNGPSSPRYQDSVGTAEYGLYPFASSCRQCDWRVAWKRFRWRTSQGRRWDPCPKLQEDPSTENEVAIEEGTLQLRKLSPKQEAAASVLTC